MAGESYPVEILDANGTERLGGTLVFTDANDQPVPSTGTGVETADGASVVTIANGAEVALTWEAHGGDTLLDYTTPAAPTVIEAGTYAITVTAAAATDLTANGYFAAGLAAGLVAQTLVSSPPANAVLLQPSVLVAVTAILAAGDTIELFVTNLSGAGEDFVLDKATICKIA